MGERRLRLRLGIFVAGSLALFCGLIVLFGGAPNLFSNKAQYTILFPEAPGIAVGTPIRKSGIRIGEVTSLDLDNSSAQVRVGIEVDRRYLPRQFEDANITRGFLSGDSAIDFLPKIGDDTQPLPRGEPLPPGTVITGIPPITPRSLLTPASGVIASAQASLERMVRSFEQLEKLAPKIGTVSDEIAALARDARLFIPELRETNRRLQKLIGGGPADPVPPARGVVPASLVALQPAELGDGGDLRTLVRDIRELVRTAQPALADIQATIKQAGPELNATLRSARLTFDKTQTTFDSVNDLLSPENRKQFNELVKNLNMIGGNVLRFSAALTTLLEEAEKGVKNFDGRITQVGDILTDVRSLTRPLAERSDALIRDITEASAQFGQAITEVRSILKVFGRENGTIQKLLSDPEVYNSLDAAAVSLARVMARAENVLRDVEVFADKVARRPELIGVGGVVKPSSGLKYSPIGPQTQYRPDWPPAVGARPVPPPSPDYVQGYPP